MTSQHVGMSNNVDISDVTRVGKYRFRLTNTNDISDLLKIAAHIGSVRTNVLGLPEFNTISDAITAIHAALHPQVTDTADISNVQRVVTRTGDTPDISNSVSVSKSFVQYDTWRPVPKPDNTIILVCRTPIGYHDTNGFNHMSLWTMEARGTGERLALKDAASNGLGWIAYGHPEWSPDGHRVAVWVQTASGYKIILIDSDGFGTN